MLSGVEQRTDLATLPVSGDGDLARQRDGDALAMLSGYTQTTSMRARRLGWAGTRGEARDEDERE